MVTSFKHPFRIDQNVGDVLSVTNFARTLADFEYRVVGCRARIRWIEQQTVREPRAPARRELPILALDVVDDDGVPAGQERWDHDPAFAAAGRTEYDDVLRAIMAQILDGRSTWEYAR